MFKYNWVSKYIKQTKKKRPEIMYKLMNVVNELSLPDIETCSNYVTHFSSVHTNNVLKWCELKYRAKS